MRNAPLLIAVIALAACNADAPSPQRTPPVAASAPVRSPTAQVTRPAPPTSGTPAFVGVPWKVNDPSGGQVGTIYTFVGDGTLTVDSPGGTRSTGRWSYVDGALTMIEDGIAYPTDILSLDATHFVIRSHNPGGTVQIVLSASR